MDSSNVVPEWPHKQLYQHNWCTLVRGRIRPEKEEATALAEGTHNVTALLASGKHVHTPGARPKMCPSPFTRVKLEQAPAALSISSHCPCVYWKER